MAQVRIELAGMRSSVEIDGAKVPSLRGFELRADVHNSPHLVLDLVAARLPGTVEGEAGVAISDQTREWLIGMGWTPPDAPALAAAFTEWDRRYREEPERFATEMLLHSGTPDTYGEAAAPYLLAILAEQAAAIRAR